MNSHRLTTTTSVNWSTTATAIKIFTLNGAIANTVGDRSGSLEVGKDADFIVLDRNIFEIPVTDVGETIVLLSVVGGVAVVDQLSLKQ